MLLMSENKITFSDAIEKVMLSNGFYAPLKLIYKEFEKYRPFSGLTPLNTIQERVQRDKRFTRIGLGVYALTKYLDKLPQIIEPKTAPEKRNYKHTMIQGIIIEIGNMEGFDTYTLDRGKIFDNKKLGNLTTLEKIPQFTYENVIRSIQYIDVIWFNSRGFPEKLFEVEDSTDFRSSLVKFTELQDFMVTFNLISLPERKTKYEREVAKSAFQSIFNRCRFIDYDEIQKFYEARLNYHEAKQKLSF